MQFFHDRIAKVNTNEIVAETRHVPFHYRDRPRRYGPPAIEQRSSEYPLSFSLVFSGYMSPPCPFRVRASQPPWGPFARRIRSGAYGCPSCRDRDYERLKGVGRPQSQT